jgi:hypothetical protein
MGTGGERIERDLCIVAIGLGRGTRSFDYGDLISNGICSSATVIALPKISCFQLTAEEVERSRSQIATLNSGRGQNIP